MNNEDKEYEYSPCEEHYVLVNDLGIPQCADCGCFFDNKNVKIQLIKRYGVDSLKEEYARLRKNMRLARDGRMSLATAFYDDSSEFGEAKYFYE
ncbi:MAG: hypothetical protein RL641_589 [Candidatus Parcubacteria bacterium]|jgi:hypothetical protein